MPDASLEVQQAILARLSGDGLLISGTAEPRAPGGVRTVGIYDHVPQDVHEPYIVVGDDTASDDDNKTREGQEIVCTVHFWSVYHGRLEVKNLMARVRRLLHHQEFNTPSFQVWELNHEFSTTLLDPDGVTQHGVQRYRLRSTDAI